MHSTHRLTAKAAVAGQDQPFRFNMFQRFADKLSDFLGALDLESTMADDAERNLLVF